MTAVERSLASGLALFVRGWVEDPLTVGAVAPSGRRLASLMTRGIGANARVIELGPGTGSFTRAILARGIAVERLALIELNANFAHELKRRMPGVTVVCGDATLPEPRLDSFLGKTDVVVSGLPLMLFSRDEKAALLERSFELLDRDGAFYQFTYGVRCPVSRRQLAALGLEAARTGLAMFNLPPAFVYRITRRAT